MCQFPDYNRFSIPAVLHSAVMMVVKKCGLLDDKHVMMAYLGRSIWITCWLGKIPGWSRKGIKFSIIEFSFVQTPKVSLI